MPDKNDEAGELGQLYNEEIAGLSGPRVNALGSDGDWSADSKRQECQGQAVDSPWPDKNDGAGEIERLRIKNELIPGAKGEWVRYTDHLARLEAVEAERDESVTRLVAERRTAIEALREIESEIETARESSWWDGPTDLMDRLRAIDATTRKALADIGGPERA